MKIWCCMVLAFAFFSWGQSQPYRDAAEAYDRVAGMLAGAAIGDAMGAPTEMWSRDQIQARYGFVTGLDSMVREPSPEGTWRINLAAGGATDDTRWKLLVMDFFSEYLAQKKPDPIAMAFARYIVKTYEGYVKGLRAISGTELTPYQEALRRAEWLVEWEKVARPYAAGDLQGYLSALHRFYGGEPVCGGILFASVVGVCYPGAPEKAYRAAYDMNIFDLGNARDLAALIAAMTAEAAAGKSPAEQLAVFRSVDPEGFFESRLVGRTAYAALSDAQAIALDARKQAGFPAGYAIGKDSLSDEGFRKVIEMAFPSLDLRNERLPFHPVEITRIGLTAMLVSGFGFLRSLQFVVNFGRDNDTVGAWVGGQLGAATGLKALPKGMVQQVFAVSRTELGQDLEASANRLAKAIQAQ